jgi:hypothetical protein
LAGIVDANLHRYPEAIAHLQKAVALDKAPRWLASLATSTHARAARWKPTP